MEQLKEGWPHLAWFLRGQLLSRVAVVLSAAAVITELCILALGGNGPICYVGLALSGVGVIVAHFRPVIGLTMVISGAVVAALLAAEFVGQWTVVVFIVFVATVRGARALPCALASAGAVYLAIVVRESGAWDSPQALVASALCATAAAGGAAVCAQENYWEALRERAQDAIAARDLEAERRVAKERLRIARDLHDAVGHEIAVISMNLGVAEVELESDAHGAGEVLQSARPGVRRVLQETQQMLDILRRGDSVHAWSPVADLTQLPALVRSFEEAGMSVDFVIDMDGSSVEPRVDVAAYRVVQEALTNSQKHGSGTVALRISGNDGPLMIEVDNPVALRRPEVIARAGHGLVEHVVLVYELICLGGGVDGDEGILRPSPPATSPFEQ